jgi:hypothetical protein
MLHTDTDKLLMVLISKAIPGYESQELWPYVTVGQVWEFADSLLQTRRCTNRDNSCINTSRNRLQGAFTVAISQLHTSSMHVRVSRI